MKFIHCLETGFSTMEKLIFIGKCLLPRWHLTYPTKANFIM